MFGDMIKKCRNILQMTQRELSVELNIPQSKIAKLENGSQNPDQRSINNFSEFFNVKIDFLFGNETFADYFNLLAEASGNSIGDISDITGFDVEFIISISEGSIPIAHREDLIQLGKAFDIDDLHKWLKENTNLVLDDNVDRNYYFFDENNNFILGRELALKQLNNIIDRSRRKPVMLDLFELLSGKSEIPIDDVILEITLDYKGKQIAEKELEKVRTILNTLFE